jgi:hypothetical protein
MRDFALKSPFFMSLGACGLKKRILVVVVGVGVCLGMISCGSNKPSTPTPGSLPDRVLASQSSTATTVFGGLVTINGYNDTLPRTSELSAGSSPGLMAVSPSLNIAGAFDASSNSIFAVNTVTATGLGQVRLPGPTSSFTIPTANPVGYAAVPSATVQGYPFLGALVVMNLTGGLITNIAVPNAQTVVANSNGSQLLVFSNDSNSVTVINPATAVPPVDLSCTPTAPNAAVCTVIPGFDRPVFAVQSGTTAYILNCGAECGGTQASIQTLDLNSFAVGAPVPVNGATYAFISGNSLYVAGNGTPTGPTCASLPNAAPTAATFCGTLDIVNLTTLTDPSFNNPALEIAIPDGYHDRMSMSINGQLFVGSKDCTNVGDVGNPVGEVRGCLAILNTNTGAVVIPPDNGNVDGLQSFTTREREYVAEGGNLRVYDTLIDALYINEEFLPLGTIDVIGYVGDVKSIDFF